MREFLQRFRPAGTPGAAARPGVPADRAAELAAELEPVFAQLADVLDQAERIRRDGRAEAGRLRAQAVALAETTVSEATAHRGGAGRDSGGCAGLVPGWRADHGTGP